MNRRWLAGITVGVMLLSQIGVAGATGTAPEDTTLHLDDNPPEEMGIQSYGPGDRIAEPDEEFIADSGPALDRYTFRSGSPIEFPIEITRYFGPVDGEGKLLHPELIEGQKALLTLRVWDVDQDYTGPDYAPEVDMVSVNGQHVGVLSGANGQWSTFTAEIPLEQLKFPSYTPGKGVTPAQNMVQIDIDTANVGVCECWAVTVDWGRMVIKGARPAVLVHGFMSNESTWDPWVNGYAPDTGLPVFAFSFDNNHGSWFDHAGEEAGRIAQAKNLFGVSKLNLVGHSKGGLDSRAYLARGGDDVKRLVMLGTPNSGSPLADIVKVGGILNKWIGLVSLIGEPALTELTVTYMKLVGNRVVGPNPTANYYTVAGDFRWKGFSNPLIWGPDDGVVAVSSVESLPYATALGRTASFHTSMTANPGEWNLAEGQLTQVAKAWPSAHQSLAFTGSGLGGGTGEFALTDVTGYEITGGSQSHAITVQGGSPATLGILWGSGALSATLTSPSGAVITAEGTGVELVQDEDSSLGLRYVLYRIQSPEAGTYQLNVSSQESSPVRYLAVGATEGGEALTTTVESASSAGSGLVATGEPITVTARVDWAGATPEPMSATAHIERPDGQVDAVTLNDDGTGSTFSATYTPASEGLHTVAVVATATGTRPLQRITLTGFQALSGADRFDGRFAHMGLDMNGDGLYDTLSVDVGLQIGTAGDYLVTGQLTDSTGRTLARASGRTTLSPGQQSVPLAFDGKTLGLSGFTGDLILTDLSLVGTGGSLKDFKAPAATFSGYDASQFQRPAIRVLPGVTDSASDLNGDSLYDQLQVQIPVEVLEAGYYDVNARLMDRNGQELGWDGVTVNLPAGESTVTLSYNGESIGRNGVDGPYEVKDFSMYDRFGAGLQLNVYEFYTTKPYLAQQFAGYVAPRPTFESVLAKIDRFGLEGKIAPGGLVQSLRAKVENAQAAWERTNHTAASNILQAVIREASAQSGNQIEAAAAQELIADCQMLIEDLAQ